MAEPVAARRKTEASWLGRMPYREAADLQLKCRESLRAGTGPERLLLLEHPHVYTLGRNADPADVLMPVSWLTQRGVEVVETDRGGQVTYHGPGQLVGYPILDLSPDRRDVRRYVRDLQTALVDTLADFGIAASARPGSEFVGVWVGEAKIAAIGIHLSRWLTTHGFALNVAPDLDLFAGIHPCGFRSLEVASIASLAGAAPPLVEVAERFAVHFAAIFERELDWRSLATPAGAATS